MRHCELLTLRDTNLAPNNINTVFKFLGLLNIVTWRLKAGMVESEKTAIARQRLVESRPRSNELSWQWIWDKAISMLTTSAKAKRQY
jgi:hypothetical protein